MKLATIALSLSIGLAVLRTSFAAKAEEITHKVFFDVEIDGKAAGYVCRIVIMHAR